MNLDAATLWYLRFSAGWLPFFLGGSLAAIAVQGFQASEKLAFTPADTASALVFSGFIFAAWVTAPGWLLCRMIGK